MQLPDFSANDHAFTRKDFPDHGCAAKTRGPEKSPAPRRLRPAAWFASVFCHLKRRHGDFWTFRQTLSGGLQTRADGP
jgi:hypothetical protein